MWASPLLALFLAAAVAGRGTRAEVVALAVECMLALGIALVLCSPYLYELFHGGNSLFPPRGGSAGIPLLGLITPSKATLVRGVPAARLPNESTGSTGRTGYFGVPLLAVVALYLWSARRSRVGLWFALFTGICVICSLGGALTLEGRLHEQAAFALPWKLVASLPLVGSAFAERFVLFAWLAVACMAALWVAGGGLWRWLLLALVAVSLLPASLATVKSAPVEAAPLIAHRGALAHEIPAGATVLVLPWRLRTTAEAMGWQAFERLSIPARQERLPQPQSGEGVRALRSCHQSARGQRPASALYGGSLPLRALRGGKLRGVPAHALLDVRAVLRVRSLIEELHPGRRYVGGIYVYDLRPALAPGGVCSTAG